MGRVAKTRSQSGRSEYMKAYRQRLQAEEPERYKQMVKLRAEKVKRKKDEEKKRIANEKADEVKKKNAIYCRRYREKTKASPPSTPKTKAAKILNSIELSTPRTAGILNESLVKKTRDRKADEDIINATAQSVCILTIRRKLVEGLQGSNKVAVSQRLGVSRNNFYYKSGRGKNPKTSEEAKQIIRTFYYREDITITYPNKQKNGSILRIMKFSQKKTFTLFKAEHPNISTKKTTFLKLRPKDVKLQAASKYQQCLCDVCDNIRMLASAIKTSMSTHSHSAPLFLTDMVSLVKETVCDFRSLLCIDRKCTECGVEKTLRPVFSEWLADDTHNKISYQQWRRVKQLVNDKDVMKMKKIPLQGFRWELIHELFSQLGEFAYHMYNNVNQLGMYSKSKKSLEPNQAVVVADFAENYTCIEYAEAQNAYYTRDSVTVHPLVIVFPDGSDVRRDAVIMISDDLKHDSDAVFSFFQQLGSHLSQNHPQVEELIVWSDGARSQYKSKKPMLHLMSNYSIPQLITWNFYGSRHGKSEADGESAVLKGYLTRSVKARQLSLTTAYDCYEFLSRPGEFQVTDGASRRHVYFISKSEVDLQRESTVCDERLCAVPGVSRIHQAYGGPENTLIYRRSSCYCMNLECKHDNTNTWNTFHYPVSEREKLLMASVVNQEEEDSDEDIDMVPSSDSDGDSSEGEDSDGESGKDLDDSGEGVSGANRSVTEVITNNPDLFETEEFDPFADDERRQRETEIENERIEEAFFANFDREWDEL